MRPNGNSKTCSVRSFLSLEVAYTLYVSILILYVVPGLRSDCLAILSILKTSTSSPDTQCGPRLTRTSSANTVPLSPMVATLLGDDDGTRFCFTHAPSFGIRAATDL